MQPNPVQPPLHPRMPFRIEVEVGPIKVGRLGAILGIDLGRRPGTLVMAVPASVIMMAIDDFSARPQARAYFRENLLDRHQVLSHVVHEDDVEPIACRQIRDSTDCITNARHCRLHLAQRPWVPGKLGAEALSAPQLRHVEFEFRIDPEIGPRPVNQKTDSIQSVAASQVEHILSPNVVAEIVTPFGMVEVGRQADQTGVKIPDAAMRNPLAEKVSRNERNHARIWSATLRGA